MISIRKVLRIFALIGSLALIASATSPANIPEEKNESSEIAGPNWSFYKIAALTTAILVTSAGFAALVSLFFPIFTYTLCYFLGACPDTLDVYVDRFLDNHGNVRRINARSINDLDPVLATLAKGVEIYEKDGNNQNIHKVNKRDAVDYVEPVLTTLTRMYELYADGDVKKKSNRAKF